MRRKAILSCLAAALLFVLFALPGEAGAQDRTYRQITYLGAPATPADVAALFRRPSVPVRLERLEAPDTLTVGADGRFGAVVNADAAALPMRVQWDFGDGDSARSLHAVHRYDAPGTYEVVLTLANGAGEAVHRHTVVVRPLEDRYVDGLPF